MSDFDPQPAGQSPPDEPMPMTVITCQPDDRMEPRPTPAPRKDRNARRREARRLENERVAAHRERTGRLAAVFPAG